jgi:hypothetical protein
MNDFECWQHLLKEERREILGDLQPLIDIDDISIEPILYEEAQTFILEYEWVGNMGTSKLCFGLKISNHLAAVVCYGAPVAPTKYTRLFGADIGKKTLQLCRGASSFWAPKWAPSKLISRSLRMLNEQYGIRLVIAYADPNAGEIGTIYQACNAIYFGMTSPGGGKRYIINGHSYDPRKVHKKFGSRARQHLLGIDPQFKTVAIHPKYRYAFVLGKRRDAAALTEHLLRYSLPHPRRHPKPTP